MDPPQRPSPPSQLGYATRGTPTPRRSYDWVVWVTAVSLLAGLVAAGLLSRGGRDYVHHERGRCASNLRQIAMACIMYAGATGGGQFPDSAGTILAETDLTAEVFTCSVTNDSRAPGPTTQQFRQQINTSSPPGTGGCCSYVYVGAGLTSQSPQPASTVVAYEPATNHGGAGGHVVYANAAVQWHPAAKLNQIIAGLPAAPMPPAAAASRPANP